jgi:hypothetical protein
MAKMEQIRQYEETINHLLQKVNEWNLPYSYSHVQNDVNWLHRQETTLRRLAETACERELTKRETAKVERIEGRVRDLLALYHVPVRFEGDPRGGTIRMTFGDRISNNWGGEDWGIYW